MPNIVVRLLSALVLVPILVGGYMLGSPYWLIFLGIITGLISLEWLKLIRNEAAIANAFCIGLFFVIFIILPSIPLWAVAFLGIPAALVGQPQHRSLALFTGVYVALPMLTILLVSDISANSLLWLASIVWLTDTFALIFGKTIGGPKLAPSLSPNKTWAGLFGGLFGALAVTGVFMMYVESATPALYVWAALVSLAGQAGDLFESKFKRMFDVKDSGALIPGHGGILDRMDSFLFAAPIVWALLAYGMIKL